MMVSGRLTRTANAPECGDDAAIVQTPVVDGTEHRVWRGKAEITHPMVGVESPMSVDSPCGWWDNGGGQGPQVRSRSAWSRRIGEVRARRDEDIRFAVGKIVDDGAALTTGLLRH